jgi:hypothetical protein
MIIEFIIKFLHNKFGFLLKNLFTLKKLGLIIVLLLLYLKKKTLPLRLSAYEFLKIFKENSKEISFMKIFISRFILFKFKGDNYFTNYSPTNPDEFSKELM